jgi:hypothetical protein
MTTINLGMYKNNRYKWIARIEVLFWRIFIWAVKKIETRKTLLLSGLFLVAALSLISFFSLNTANTFTNLSHQAPVNLSSGQRNTLLVFIDNGTDPRPQLRSIWLMLELPEKSSFTFLPLYPAAVKNYTTHDLNLETTFAVDENQSLNESFVTNLTEMNIWWNDFILIDDYVQGSLFELTNGSIINGRSMTGVDIRSGYFTPETSKSDQLKFQGGLIQYFCQKITLAPLHPDFENSVDSFASHIITSIDKDALTASWKGDRFSNGVDCNFPTLHTSISTGSSQ